MVNAVSNDNRNTVYTAAGAGAGLLAGGAYGYTKSLLKDDAPTDAFVRTYLKNDVKNGVEEAKKTFTEAFKDSDVAALKTELTSNAAKYGLAEVKDADGKVTKDLNAVIEEFVKDGDKALEKDALKEKMAKALGDTQSGKAVDPDKMIKLQKAAKELADNADDAAKTAFVKNNADILNIKDADVDSTAKKTVAELKQLAEDAAKPLSDAKTKIMAQFENGKLKDLAEGADDAAKAAHKAVKDAAKNVKLWAGAKWAAIGTAVLGAATYAYAKLTDNKAEQPKDEQQA